ncbi:colicin V family bacteriocin [Enterobacter asburiae]
MKELTNAQVNTVAGAGGDVGREIAQGVGAGAGTYLGGTTGAIVGGIAAGQAYDWASTHTPDSSLSPSGLGGTLGGTPFNPHDPDTVTNAAGAADFAKCFLSGGKDCS